MAAASARRGRPLLVYTYSNRQWHWATVQCVYTHSQGIAARQIHVYTTRVALAVCGSHSLWHSVCHWQGVAVWLCDSGGAAAHWPRGKRGAAHATAAAAAPVPLSVVAPRRETNNLHRVAKKTLMLMKEKHSRTAALPLAVCGSAALAASSVMQLEARYSTYIHNVCAHTHIHSHTHIHCGIPGLQYCTTGVHHMPPSRLLHNIM